MKVVDFYNQGAQVQIEHPGVDMTHSFTAGGSGEVEEIGYVPKSNSGRPQGAAHDIIEHDGKSLLALKEGHIYDVTIVGPDDTPETTPLVHAISAEHGHVLLPLPTGSIAEVVEHDPTATAEAAEGADEQPEQEQQEGEGMLGDDSGDEAAGTE